MKFEQVKDVKGGAVPLAVMSANYTAAKLKGIYRIYKAAEVAGKATGTVK